MNPFNEYGKCKELIEELEKELVEVQISIRNGEDRYSDKYLVCETIERVTENQKELVKDIIV